MNHAEKAGALFASGSSCSQSVFAAFAPDFGIDEALAHRIAAGLGGGFGRKQYLCGAVSGAALVLGLAFGNSSGSDTEMKEATYAKVYSFISEMERELGASDCRTLLLGNDTATREGRDAVKEAGLSAKVCRPLVIRVAEKLEAILGSDGIMDAAAFDAPVDAPVDAAADIVVRRVGAECFGIAADFRFRMFADIDPGVDHSAEKEAYVRAVADYFSRHASDPGQILVCAFAMPVTDAKDKCTAGTYIQSEGIPDAGIPDAGIPDADIPVGCAAMIVAERPPRLGRLRGDSAYIHNVYVLPAFRGRGIARTLMEFLHREAALTNARRIGLHASTFGAPLYSAMGYTSGGKYMEMELSDRAGIHDRH